MSNFPHIAELITQYPEVKTDKKLTKKIEKNFKKLEEVEKEFQNILTLFAKAQFQNVKEKKIKK